MAAPAEFAGYTSTSVLPSCASAHIRSGQLLVSNRPAVTVQICFRHLLETK